MHGVKESVCEMKQWIVAKHFGGPLVSMGQDSTSVLTSA